MNLWSEIRASRSSLDDYAQLIAEWGLHAQFSPMQMTMDGQPAEPIGNSFIAYVQKAYKANGVVFACNLTRLMLFSQARFAFRRRNLPNGRPGDYFHTSALDILERPWPNGTTADLTARMIQDADLAGNFYGTIIDRRFHRMRPDWTWIVLGSDQEPDDPDIAMDSEILGFVYDPPKGRVRGLLPEEVVHFAPIPDPEAHYRGMSWLTPVLREIQADGSGTAHKWKFFRNAATPNLVIKHVMDPEKVKQFAAWFAENHEGAHNAYKTLHLAGGADAMVVGKDFKELEFKATQGHGETRLAAAAGLHPSIVPFSEGMEGSSLSEGNFKAARRLVSDKTLRFLWANAAGSLATVIDVPSRSELAPDPRDIAWLQEDQEDAAAIQQLQASTINSYVQAGFTPESAVGAVVNGDPTLLVHTGLHSVQLLPPGADDGERTVSVPLSAAGDLLARGWALANGHGDPDESRRALEGAH